MIVTVLIILKRRRKQMSKAYMGAIVQYCGHDATFVADIFQIGNVNVVKAGNEKHIDKQLRRPAKNATHSLSDFPSPGCWMPQRGVFVVPEKQVKELK
jgi:hypothetical protein